MPTATTSDCVQRLADGLTRTRSITITPASFATDASPHGQQLARLLARAAEVTVTVERRRDGIQVFLSTDRSLHGQSSPHPTLRDALCDALDSLFLAVDFPARGCSADGSATKATSAAPSTAQR